MRELSAVQFAMQQYVVSGDAQVAALIGPGPRANANARLAVYYHAYRERLVEALSTDFEALAAVLGTEAFRAVCLAYVAAVPSRFRNIRWYGGAFADFLQSTPPWSARPELAELARFEWTLTLAFDAADAPHVTFDDLAGLPPEAWGTLRMGFHPSLRLLSLHSNSPAVRMAVGGGDALPALALQHDPVHWRVWRKDGDPHFHSLSPEEHWAMDAVRRGEDFGALCEGLTEFVDADHAPQLAAQLLQTWIADGLIAQVWADGM